MSRLTHDEYFIQLLALVAARSTCPRRSVGAIIVDANHKILATGYNGVPRGFPHCTEEPCPGALDLRGDTRRCLAVHAEANAILQCARLDLARTIYVSCTPCFECAKLIVNTPVRRVVSTEEYTGAGLDVLRHASVKIDLAFR